MGYGMYRVCKKLGQEYENIGKIVDFLAQVSAQLLGTFIGHKLQASDQVNRLKTLYRSFDTLSLLFEALEGDANSELFKKIETYRKALTVYHARHCLS